MQYNRTRSAGDPDVIATACNRLEIEASEHFSWQFEIGKPPAQTGTIGAGQHQSSLADGHRLLAQQLQGANGSPPQRVHIGGAQRSLPQCRQAAPASCQGTGLGILMKG